jgi:predicted AAA+ superfamily ATPase
MELLFDQLPNTVGSVLSINSLREDLEVSFNTTKKWIEIFEKLYGIFRVYPFGPSKIKAVKKEAKLYFWDWSQVPKDRDKKALPSLARERVQRDSQEQGW